MTIEGIMEFYKYSNADVMAAMDGDIEGVLWTLPACSTDAVKQAIRQLVRCKATRIKWVRRVRLHSKSRGVIDAIAIFILPDMKQSIYRVDTGEEMKTEKLSDSCLLAVLAEMQAV